MEIEGSTEGIKMTKVLMKRCASCEEIKFGFAGFDIKIEETDEWDWVCDTAGCVNAYLSTKNNHSLEVNVVGKAEEE